MRRRQVKKFAKNAKRNKRPYDEAYSGTGSRKFNRRRRAFGRYSHGGNAWWDQARQVKRQTARLSKMLADGETFDGPAVYKLIQHAAERANVLATMVVGDGEEHTL